jgi:hypothetical protein
MKEERGMLKRFCSIFLAVSALLFISAPASTAAITIYDNIGTTYTGLYPVYGASVQSGQFGWAGQFIATNAGLFNGDIYNVTEIDLLVDVHKVQTWYTGAFQLKLFSDASNAPGTLLYGPSNQTAIEPYPGQGNMIYNTLSVRTTSFPLTIGTTYWLALVYGDQYTDVDWYSSSTAKGLVDLLSTSGGTFSAWGTGAYLPAFRIIGETASTNPVPIPAAVWLLGSGLMGLIGVRRRFKKQV